MIPEEGVRFQPGHAIFDTKLGAPAIFCRYTPDHPEYVATVRYRFSDEVGVLPFQLSRFRIIGAEGFRADEALPHRRGMGWQRQPDGDRFAQGDVVRQLVSGAWIRVHPGDAARGWASWTVAEALGDFFTVRRPDPAPRPARRPRRKAVDPQPERRRFDMEM